MNLNNNNNKRRIKMRSRVFFYEARVYHAVDMFAEADNLRYYWVANIRVPRALRYPTFSDMHGTINPTSVVYEILEDVYKTIDELERTEIEIKEFTRYKELFGWLLIPAMIIGLGGHTIDRTIFRKQL